MISRRYAVPVALLLVIALVPTLIHGYLGTRTDDGLSAARSVPELAGYRIGGSSKNPGWGKEIFDSGDWFERNYRGPAGDTLRLFVARSFDQKKLYHHPDLVLSYGRELEPARLVPLPGMPGVPVHLLQHKRSRGVTAYVLLDGGGEFVGDPVSHLLRNMFWRMFSAQRQMTLFYVSTDSAVPDFEGSAAARLLANAIRAFQGQPRETVPDAGTGGSASG